MDWTGRRERLRAIIKRDRCICPASVFDGVSAADIGFEAMMFAGSVASFAVLAAPDVCVLTLTSGRRRHAVHGGPEEPRATRRRGERGDPTVVSRQRPRGHAGPRLSVGAHVRVCLQGHHSYWAAVNGVHETLKALRGGAKPSELKAIAASELQKRVLRRTEHAKWQKEFLEGR